ncbi:MAG: hypothetical protein H0W69_01850 [Gemmatimonadaceae bacterium]|nr:hypothetical protein [Gemmatimonadaceae bacterium]
MDINVLRANFIFLALVGSVAACSPGTTTPRGSEIGRSSDTSKVAITDLGTGTFKGFQGGLYPAGSNAVPSDHDAAGLARRNAIRPLDINGVASPSGKYVLISIGMSNTTQEWCSQGSGLPCDQWTFMGAAQADPAVNRSTLVMVNGAAGGQDAVMWASASDANYDRIRDTRLAPLGLSEKQVQIAWVKLANKAPTQSLPSPNADAYIFMQYLGDVARSLKQRYPNLQQIFLSSRIYGGYATTNQNPEPYAYEGGFSVKWVIEAQIVQQRTGTMSARAGNLSYSSGAAPWLAWGPYLWADGMQKRSDGLTWAASDFVSDGTHPSQSGETKVAGMLLSFFKNSVYTRCWFTTGSSCT